MKILYGFLAVLFVVFAAVQFNDADSLVWILLYCLVAVLCGMAFMEKTYRPILLATLLLILVWMGTLFPAFIDWLQSGAESITGSMKAESPHIELVREFLGLFLSLLTLLFLLKSKKKSVEKSDLV